MNIPNHQLPRRSFLSGAASLLGAASVGLAPQLSKANTRGSIRNLAGQSEWAIHYWSGNQFVPGNQAHGEAPPKKVKIEIIEHATDAVRRNVDVRLPGGMFHAFQGGTHGIDRTSFITELSLSAELGFTIGDGVHEQTFELSRSVLSSTPLALGSYLISDPSIDVDSLFIDESSALPVRNLTGSPASQWCLLIRISLP